MITFYFRDQGGLYNLKHRIIDLHRARHHPYNPHNVEVNKKDKSITIYQVPPFGDLEKMAKGIDPKVEIQH